MTANDHLIPCSPGTQVDFLEVVKDIDGHVSKLDDLRFGNRAGLGVFVIVTPDSDHWCNGSQLLQHFGRPDITGMNNEGSTREHR